MTKSNQLALGALGLGLLFLVLTTDSDTSSQPEPPKPPDEPPPVPKSEEAPPESDPLPDYPLTQQNVIAAITEFTEHGQTTKFKSVVVKALSAPLGLRAYVVAAIGAVPEQLKADLVFVKQFEKDEGARVARIEAERKKEEAIIRATESAVVVVVTKVNAIAGAVVALGVALGEAARELIRYLGTNPPRRGEDQIYPGYEGNGVRRGVSFAPNLPYITKAEIDLADKVRRRWVEESNRDEVFLSLPEVPKGTAFRFAPRWDDFQAAAKKLAA